MKLSVYRVHQLGVVRLSMLLESFEGLKLEFRDQNDSWNSFVWTHTSFFAIHTAHFGISNDLALFSEDTLISLRTFLQEINQRRVNNDGNGIWQTLTIVL